MVKEETNSEPTDANHPSACQAIWREQVCPQGKRRMLIYHLPFLLDTNLFPSTLLPTSPQTVLSCRRFCELLSSCLRSKIQVTAMVTPHPLLAENQMQSVWMLLTLRASKFSFEGMVDVWLLPRLSGYLKGSGSCLAKQRCGEITSVAFFNRRGAGNQN